MRCPPGDDIFPCLTDVRALPLSCSHDGCDADAEWHVVWNSNGDNGLCCHPHMLEVRRRWVYLSAHRYQLTCSVQTARFADRTNGCVV